MQFPIRFRYTDGVDWTVPLGTLAAAFSVVGVVIAVLRRVVRAWAGLQARITAIEDALRVSPRCTLLDTVTVSWNGRLVDLPPGSMVSIREWKPLTAMCRVEPWGVEVEVPTQWLKPEVR